MRIAFVLWEGRLGGGEKMTAELAGGLRAGGIDASLFFVRDAADLAIELERREIPYRNYGAPNARRAMLGFRRFVNEAMEVAPDGIVLPNVGHLAITLRLGGYKAPLLAIQHGDLYLIDQMSLMPKARRRFERSVGVRLIDAEVAVSDHILADIMRQAHPRRVARIHHGVDLQRFTPEPDTRDPKRCVIGCASRMVKGKGVTELVRAFAQVAAEDSAVTLRIAGDGPARTDVADLVRSLSLEARVDMPGVAQDMPAFWRDVDIAVMPSVLPESFGLVALEAMAVGRPVVATRNGGIVEVVDDGVTGTLVDPGDSDALARVLLDYVHDDDRRRNEGRAGRERCESHFDLRGCVATYARLLHELTQAKRGYARGANVVAAES